ncbi:DUF2249 domain-containing protein [Paenibacillus antri]|uniref:DUF2249 domain-containing protein n=1 Tax=Paenibacillus antri TaxID=2582848 RepID=A0A5R9G8I5_9BACL|nr:DUF2249 domain-containing protein [Paenibacillus antri]TLS50666.1 DUF2249 domain-containing protein [Paenibacillus antri]
MRTEEPRIVQLDVRPHLRKKLEPFQIIMNAVNGLEKEALLVLHATFKPTPLLGLLKMKGYANRVESAAPDHWMVAFLHKSQGRARLEALDFRTFAGLEEPDSIEETAEETAEGAGERAVPVDSSEPAGRVTELDNRGLQPPQPMVRTLKALEGCEPGDRVVIHNDRVPMFLIEELQGLGYSYDVAEQGDGSAKVTITKS